MRSVRPLGLAAAVVLFLGACGTTDDAAPGSASDAPDGGAAPTQAAGPVSVVDGSGVTVELPAPATRVVVLEWGEAEIAAALGAPVVGVADTAGFVTWVGDDVLPSGVEDVGTRGEPSLDAIAALNPDLIITTPTGAEQARSQVGDRIPVVSSFGADTGGQLDNVRQDVRLLAEVTGTQERGEELIAEMDATLAEAATAVQDAGAAGTPFLMADGWKEGSTVSVRMFADHSLVSDIAEEIGLVNAWQEPGDEAYGLAQTDVEGLSPFTDPDLHFYYSASDDDVFAGDLSGNPIWDSLPFVQQDQITHLEPGTWTFGGPISVMSIAEQFAAPYLDQR